MKNKKLLACILSLFMTVNGLSGCANKSIEKSSGTSDSVLTVTETDYDSNLDEEFSMVRIGKRDYRVSEHSVSYTIQKGDNLWSIAQDLHKHEEEIMGYNNLESDLIFPGDEINVPVSAFKDVTKNMGIKVSEKNGDINWDVVSYFTDFTFITCIDFSKDRYEDEDVVDIKFKTNIKGCEDNSIPYGVVAIGDISGIEYSSNIQTGTEDAKQLVSNLKNYNITYPVIFELDDFGSLSFSMTDYEEDDDKKLSENYCLDFLNELKKQGYYPILCISDEVYLSSVSKNNELKKFDKIIVKTNDDFMYKIINRLNTNISMQDDRDFPGMEKFKSFCPVYIDNTRNGIESIVKEELEKDFTVNHKPLIIGGIVGTIVGGALIIKFGPGIYLNVVDKAKKDAEKTIKKFIKRKKYKKK